MDLNTFWFILLGLLLAGYAILDGFDLGVGILHPVARTEIERRVILNAIGPIWDGNEVWLVTFGGALFAAFPEAYATAFSGFYAAFMLVLFALIFRALSIEFRSKFTHPVWRRFWDWGFFGSSLLATILFGVAVGAAMAGVPLDNQGYFAGRFVDQLSPYAILVGLMTVAMFLMHGSIYLGLKTEGELRVRIERWMWRGFGFFLITYFLTTVATLVTVEHAVAAFKRYPWSWSVVVLNVLAVANIPRALFRRNAGVAFLSSSAAIAAFVLLFGLALFPNLVTSNPNPEYSLTVYNSASSPSTLRTMALIALIGMPFVVTYTGIVYWTFRGKVLLGPHSY
ncbi:MAG: cytochrome d ubiquinol oxidase subunit II [Isosphaeraceae bacterium]